MLATSNIPLHIKLAIVLGIKGNKRPSQMDTRAPLSLTLIANNDFSFAIEQLLDLRCEIQFSSQIFPMQHYNDVNAWIKNCIGNKCHIVGI